MFLSIQVLYQALNIFLLVRIKILLIQKDQFWRLNIKNVPNVHLSEYLYLWNVQLQEKMFWSINFNFILLYEKTAHRVYSIW